MKTFSRKRLAIAVAVLNCLAFPLAAQNNPPVANNDNYSVSANTTLSVAAPGVLANDTDPNNDALTAMLIASVTHGTLQLNANGSFTYTPASNFIGTDSFTYRASDGNAESGRAQVTITVFNRPPVASDDSFSGNEDAVLTVPAPGVLGNDTDRDGNPLTAVLVANVSHGTIQLNANGSFTYTPATNFNGTDSFAYAASDGIAVSGSATVTIIVNPVNDPPEATSAELHVGANGSLAIPFLPRRLGDLFLASDVDRDPLTIRIIQLPSHGTLTGTLPFVNYQPNSNFVGTDVLAYVANDGQVDSSVGTLTFIVLPLVSINNVSVIEGSFSAVGVATFSVTLSAPSTETVAVNWATRDGTAKASSDYTAALGTLFFLPGVQQQTIRVSTITDRLFEPDETFFVDLSHGSINFDLSFPGFGTGAIVNDDLFIGEAQGIPPDAIVKVGERFVYGVKWTHPVRWRLLDTVDIRITDDEGDILYVRFDEPSNTYSLFNPANGKFMRPALPGSRTLFETQAATMDLQDSSVMGTGPDGPSVTLNLGLRFKPKAAGRVFRVEAFATDDDGNQQGFDEAGIIAVLRR